MNLKDIKLGIIGLGYVGLPLALEFGKQRKVVGFDISEIRVSELKKNFDSSGEFSKNEIKASHKLKFSSELNDLRACNTFIISVPTPINKKNQPDLRILKKATKMVGKILKKNDIVIFESTVYPGTTEEICVPLLEKESNLIFNKNFFVGYSPERINPGDKVHTLKDIVKVTSGSDGFSSRLIDSLYASIVKAGAYLAESIKTAEAAKIIENTQRDLNIALINELAIIFEKMDLDTSSVLQAANTKWNFLDFRPGLVGGHCIGVDPYYLTYKAKELGLNPQLILAGRSLNDSMSKYVAMKFYKQIEKIYPRSTKYKVVIFGASFKEDCKDVRNSKIFDVVSELSKRNCQVDIFDPNLKKNDLIYYQDLNFAFRTKLKISNYHGILLGVPHREFKSKSASWYRKFGLKNAVFFDLKSVYPINQSDIRL